MEKLITALDVQHEKLLSEKRVRSEEGEDGESEVKDPSPAGAGRGEWLFLQVGLTKQSDEFWEKCRDNYPHVYIIYTTWRSRWRRRWMW